MQSDPENRLVTGEFERRWEASLRELKSAEEELDRLRHEAPSYIIPGDLLDVLRDVGPRLPELWNAKLLSGAQKKALLRSLIDKVVIHRLAPDQVQTRVVWRGGTTTSDVVRVTVGKFAWLSGAAEMEAAIKQMTAEGHSDAAIAEHLTVTGHRSPRADKVLESTVRLTRLRLGILRATHQSHRRHVEGFLTIPQLAKKLGVSRWWISGRINKGTIKAKKDEKTKCYPLPDTLAERKRTANSILRAMLDSGWILWGPIHFEEADRDETKQRGEGRLMPCSCEPKEPHMLRSFAGSFVFTNSNSLVNSYLPLALRMT